MIYYVLILGLRQRPSFFIPYIEYIQDLQGLIEYLGDKIYVGFVVVVEHSEDVFGPLLPNLLRFVEFAEPAAVFQFDGDPAIAEPLGSSLTVGVHHLASAPWSPAFTNKYRSL